MQSIVETTDNERPSELEEVAGPSQLGVEVDVTSGKRKLRILYFYQYFGTPKGAWSTRVYEFGRRWADAGHEVTVITSVYDKSDLRPDKLISRFDCDGIEVVVLNIRLSNKDGIFVRLGTFAAYALLSSWYAFVLRADVVVASSGPVTVAIPGLVSRFVRKRPLVFEVRDLWPEGAIQLGIFRHRSLVWAARAFERLCYGSASRIVALSEGMASWIRGQYGFQNITVVPNASDNELFDCVTERIELPSWASGKFLVVYTGTLGVANDCVQILDMAECLQGRGVRDGEIVILGDGKHREKLKEEARVRGLHNVRFLGIVPRDEWREWLKRAGCVLVVYKSGSVMDTASPNKLFDAFAAGSPVIQTTEGWIKDLFAKEGCGINVPPDSPAEMADAIVSLVRDSELRERIRGNSRRVGRELFDRDLLSSRMLAVLHAAAAEGKECRSAYSRGGRVS